jgi:hypothetical protein
VKVDGTVVVWGRNDFGQCILPWPNSRFCAVAAGNNHTLALRLDRTIVAWGADYAGQCNVPNPNSDYVAVAAGVDFSLGLKVDGSIVAWGSNGYGECDAPYPNAGFVALATGSYHSVGLRNLTTDIGAGCGNLSRGFGGLLLASPNPAQGGVQHLVFELGRAGRVRLEVYDVAGRRVRSVVDRFFTAGVRTLDWDCRGNDGQPLPSGLYCVRIDLEGKAATQKIVVSH